MSIIVEGGEDRRVDWGARLMSPARYPCRLWRTIGRNRHLSRLRLPTQLFGARGALVNATSIKEFSYGAPGSLMAIYFGCLETAVPWRVDHGKQNTEGQKPMSRRFSLVRRETAIKSHSTFEPRRRPHSTPQS
jgi:hypothetical protein